MNYKVIYYRLCQRGQQRASTKKEANFILGYSEKHHITPKCMGGKDENDNLVFLSAREHFIAHILLKKIYPKHPGLLLALNRMLSDNQGNKLNGKSYDKLKIEISDYRKSQNKHNNESIKRASDKLSGRTVETHEYIAIAVNKKVGRTKDNHSGIGSMAIKQKGKTKENNKGVANGAAKRLGRRKETDAGMKASSEKQKGRSKETHEYLNRISELRKGRTKENNEGIRTMSELFKGQTKDNCERVRRAAESRTKLPKELRIKIVYWHDEENISFNDIKLTLKNQFEFDVSHGCISGTYKREKELLNAITQY